MTTALGVFRIGCIAVPLYDTLGENAVEYIINHAEVCRHSQPPARQFTANENPLRQVKAVFVAGKSVDKLVHLAERKQLGGTRLVVVLDGDVT